MQKLRFKQDPPTNLYTILKKFNLFYIFHNPNYQSISIVFELKSIKY